MPTIPLWLVFILQSLVVALSFTALILVLVLQQQAEYKDSVFREIGLRQDVIDAAMTAPIITREHVHTQLATRLELDHSLWFNYGDTIAMEHVQRFLNFTFFMIYNDPLAYTVFQYRLSPYNRIPGKVGSYGLLYGVVGMTSDNIVAVTQFPATLVVAPNPTFPLQFTTTFGSPVVFAGSPQNEEQNLTRWGGCVVLVDSVTNVVRFIIVMFTPFEYNVTAGATSLSLAYSMDIYYLVNLANQSLITPDTKAVLVERFTDEVVASMNVGATLYNEEDADSWTISAFPNQAIIAQFNATDSKCDYSLGCTKYVEDDGENIVMMQRMTTDYKFRMDFFQITPRSFYFAAGEATVRTGIIIGVVAAALVLLSCVVIWFAIRGPIRQLRENMELAAVMRNDEVEDTSSVLTEMNDLSQSFIQMNDKLLQARAFMPQSMLCMTEDSNEDNITDLDEVSDAEDGGGEGVGSLQRRDSTDFSSDKRSTSPSVLSHSNRSSGRSSHAGAKRSSKNGGGIVIPATYASVPLAPKKVGVLILNARGTHKLAIASGAKLEQEQVRLVELVERCARAEKGVVDAFQGDHFVVTFNAARAVAAPGQNGAIMSLSVEDGARRQQLVLQKFSMGLSVGRALVGNVGSMTMKKNVTVGSVFSNAVGLERLAKQVDRTCVVNSRCLNDLEHFVHYMILGSVQLSDDHSDVAACVMGLVEGSGGNEEWMYQMEGKEDPFGAYNDLASTYIKMGASAVKDGTATMVATAEEGPHGIAPRHLQTLIERRLKRELYISEMNQCDLPIVLTTDYDVR